MGEGKCYGRWAATEKCRACEFTLSCQLFTATEGRMNRSLGGQNIDEVGDWAPDLADSSHIPGEEPEQMPDVEPAQVAGLDETLRFIFNLDYYTLGIVSEILAPQHLKTKRLTVAELARLKGVTRQRMHYKLLEVATKSPELKTLLACVLMKIRKGRFAPRQAPLPTHGLVQPSFL
jgi:hypothetical protein